jgi:hypothetical protein
MAHASSEAALARQRLLSAWVSAEGVIEEGLLAFGIDQFGLAVMDLVPNIHPQLRFAPSVTARSVGVRTRALKNHLSEQDLLRDQPKRRYTIT